MKDNQVLIEALKKIASCKRAPGGGSLSEHFVEIATQALKEHSEVRLYSEEEVRKAIEFGKELQQGKHGNVLISDFISSLTPKESEVSEKKLNSGFTVQEPSTYAKHSASKNSYFPPNKTK
jgi:hypothetical protein